MRRFEIFVKGEYNVCGYAYLQRSSISPAEREKYRPRSPPDTHELKKVKKEEKDGHVS